MALGGELAIRMAFDFDADPKLFQETMSQIKGEIDKRLGVAKSQPEPEEAKPEPVKSDRWDSFFKGELLERDYDLIIQIDMK